jgi:hypothetical protein
MFIRTRTICTPATFRKNNERARDAYVAYRADKTGTAQERALSFALAALNVQRREGTESRRGLVAFGVLANGPGTYSIAEIAKTVSATLGETVSAGQVRADISAHLSPRAFEAQPFFPFSIVLAGRKSDDVIVSHCPGAREAAEALIAPRERKAKKEKVAELPALPAPSTDVA